MVEISIGILGLVGVGYAVGVAYVGRMIKGRYTRNINIYNNWGDNPKSMELNEVELPSLDKVVFKLDARDYVNMANGVVYQHKEPHQHCREITDGTLELSLKLMEQNNDMEPASNLRAVVYFPPNSIGHQYLEIKENGKWIPYETTRKTPELNPSFVKSYSKDTKKSKSLLVIPLKYRGRAHARTTKGTKNWHPTIRGRFKSIIS